MAEKKKKWIQKAIKHPGRLTEAAARSGVSKLQKAEQWSHSSDPSKRSAGILGKRFIKGKLHEGGVVPESGAYEMQKGEMVIPASKPGMGGTMIESGAERPMRPMPTNRECVPNQPVSAMPNTPGSEGCGHWEIDGESVKFVK